MKIVTAVLLAVYLTSGPLVSLTFADEPPNTETVKKPEGILPIPDYSGDLMTRNRLTGDWGGTRTDLASKGLQFDLDWTQYLQKVTSGGRNRDSGYGSGFDYSMKIDLMRMGVLPGALVNFKAQSRFGSSVNPDAGSILPVNTGAFFPMTDTLDEDVDFTITTLSYTQFLSEQFGVLIGKLDTLDGDLNEFASGRGQTQFMNSNFIFNTSLALRMPYSTLGTGVVWQPVAPGPKGGVLVQSILIATSDSSESSGFDTLDDGTSWLTEGDFQYRLGDLPGGMNLGFLYSFNQDFAKIGSRLVFQPGEGLSIPEDDETWALYWSGWQYLVVWDPSDKPIDLSNRIADHQGIGVFARMGTADRDTNPAEFSVSGGIGGRGFFGRRDDTYGIAYYYTKFQSSRFTGLIGLDDQTQGAETYYSYAITPALHMTFSLQYVNSVLPNPEDAYIVGGRLRLSL